MKIKSIMLITLFGATVLLSACKSKSETNCFEENGLGDCLMLCSERANEKACKKANELALKECIDNGIKRACGIACMSGNVLGHAPGEGPFCAKEKELSAEAQ